MNEWMNEMKWNGRNGMEWNEWTNQWTIESMNRRRRNTTQKAIKTVQDQVLSRSFCFRPLCASSAQLSILSWLLECHGHVPQILEPFSNLDICFPHTKGMEDQRTNWCFTPGPVRQYLHLEGDQYTQSDSIGINLQSTVQPRQPSKYMYTWMCILVTGSLVINGALVRKRGYNFL